MKFHILQAAEAISGCSKRKPDECNSEEPAPKKGVGRTIYAPTQKFRMERMTAKIQTRSIMETSMKRKLKEKMALSQAIAKMKLDIKAKTRKMKGLAKQCQHIAVDVAELTKEINENAGSVSYYSIEQFRLKL